MGFGKKYIKPFFFSSSDPDRIKVPYLISFIMISLTIIVVILQIVIVMECYRKKIEVQWDLVPLAGVLMASAGGFIAVYNQGKKNSALNRASQETSKEDLPQGGDPEDPSETI